MSSSNSLKTAEWALFFTVLFFVFSFYVVSKTASLGSLQQLISNTEIKPLIQIAISGFVQRPGIYEVSKGSQLCEVLDKARPKPLADLSQLNLNTILEESCEICIPSLKCLQIRVGGCVKEEVTLVLPLGSKICDLKDRISLTTDADLKFLRKKKLLKNNEIICIPKKTPPSHVEKLGVGTLQVAVFQ